MVDKTGSGGHFSADVEGLTIFYGADGAGYLIASSQGSSNFKIYDRNVPNGYIATFNIVSGTGGDGVSGTDGIEVSSVPLGSLFPNGLFVAQDSSNSGGNQNYKYVSWRVIAEAGGLITR